jgi:hypothetical protein
MLNGLTRYATSSAPQSRFAVHSHGLFVLFSNIQKSVQYAFFGRVSIRKLHIIMVNTNILKFFIIVSCVFIQPKHCAHVQFIFEKISIVVCIPQADRLPLWIDTIIRTHESYKSIRNDPSHISIFDFLLLEMELGILVFLILPT